MTLPNNPIFWIKTVSKVLACLALAFVCYTGGVKSERLKWLEKDARQTQEIDRLRKEKEERALSVDAAVKERQNEVTSDNAVDGLRRMFNTTGK